MLKEKWYYIPDSQTDFKSRDGLDPEIPSHLIVKI
jgi:hypothetical protein